MGPSPYIAADICGVLVRAGDRRGHDTDQSARADRLHPPPAVSLAIIRYQVPSAATRRCQVHTVCYCPNTAGRSRQGISHRYRYMIPSTIERASDNGRPCRTVRCSRIQHRLRSLGSAGPPATVHRDSARGSCGAYKIAQQPSAQTPASWPDPVRRPPLVCPGIATRFDRLAVVYRAATIT